MSQAWWRHYKVLACAITGWGWPPGPTKKATSTTGQTKTIARKSINYFKWVTSAYEPLDEQNFLPIHMALEISVVRLEVVLLLGWKHLTNKTTREVTIVTSHVSKNKKMSTCWCPCAHSCSLLLGECGVTWVPWVSQSVAMRRMKLN